MNNLYLSLDIETTGLNSDRHQILEVAGVLNLNHMDVRSCPNFRFLVKPEGDIIGNPYALVMNQRLLSMLADGKGIPAAEVGLMIAEVMQVWKERYGDPDTKFHLLGKNVSGFDYQFVKKQIPGWPDHLIHYRMLDIGSMYATMKGIPGQSELDKEVSARLLFDEGSEHQAYPDACVALELARQKFREWFFEELYGTDERCRQTAEDDGLQIRHDPPIMTNVDGSWRFGH